MIITKSMFMEYLRCKRYAALDKMYKNRNIDPYEREKLYKLIGNLQHVSDGEDVDDLISMDSKHLQTMMPYFNEVEIYVGRLANKILGGVSKYSRETQRQQKFIKNFNGYDLLCFVDIYNEQENGDINIIEVKATTTNKFMSLGYTENSEKISIFSRDINGTLYLKEKDDPSLLEQKKYKNQRAKLLDKLSDVGTYVYDLAFQKFVISSQYPSNTKFYLGVLNHEYVFDGTYSDEVPKYDLNVVSLIDIDEIIDGLQPYIELDIKRVISYIEQNDSNRCQLGKHCKLKKLRKCQYSNLCYDMLPKYNSIFNYFDNHHGFKDDQGIKHDRFDMIKDGIVRMEDVPDNWLKRKKNQIQKDCVINHKEYINEKKIIDGIKEIKYPIYHLDFESFPCPLPRYRGEKPYSQSVFQFSLHIERKPGVCDKEEDHFEFLAKDHKDHRRELVQAMCTYIKDDGGSIMVYNQAFEKTRLREFGEIFMEFKGRMQEMMDRLFDLMYIVKTNTNFYKSMGYNEEEAKEINYYHENLYGSYSIKKVLPIFSELTYKGMVVGNGMEAVYAYAGFDKLTTAEYHHKYQALIEYCKQDTWAMVEVLDSICKMVKIR